MPQPLPSFEWPLHARTQVIRSGRFPLDDRAFDTIYKAQTHALHIYDYHGVIRVGGRLIDLRPGDMTLSPAGQETAYDLPEPGQHLCIHFSSATGDGGTCSIPIHASLGPRRDFVSSRVLEIASLHTLSLGRQGELAAAAAGALMHELLLYLALIARDPAPGRASPHTDGALNKLVELIQDQLHRPLTVRELADRVGMTQNYLAKQFRHRFGTTIPRFLLVRRIELARQLLVTTDLPIHRIAARVGMPDPQHFNKQFRRLVGVSPTTAREQGIPSNTGEHVE